MTGGASLLPTIKLQSYILAPRFSSVGNTMLHAELERGKPWTHPQHSKHVLHGGGLWSDTMPSIQLVILIDSALTHTKWYIGILRRLGRFHDILNGLVLYICYTQTVMLNLKRDYYYVYILSFHYTKFLC